MQTGGSMNRSERPFIFNHMEISLDGKIMGKYLWIPETNTESDPFYRTIFGPDAKFTFQAIVEGRTTIQISGNTLKLGSGKIVWDFKRLDDGKPGALAGAWLITGRVTDNGMQTITPGARKTMKILSGSRFQWIAYNSETKEFFGTGGGTYTTENGKYTETIEVFSRDNSRVGAKLEFDFSFVDGNWRHSGKSSKGDPIDEIWTQRQKLGI